MKPAAPGLSATLLFALVTAPQLAQAQQLYRCGNTFSQTPCASDAASARIGSYAAPAAASGVSGQALCAAKSVGQMPLADTGTARVVSVDRMGTEVIQYAGQAVAVRRYQVLLNTVGPSGMITGQFKMACYLSEDERRVLKLEPGAGRP